ncbi:MAG: gliding motility protein GldC [Bacteroidetes bacterium]|nr:MAG: gliding motility protein GldC [Bacteroidota bacterium]
MKTSDITIRIGLDKDKRPVDIRWKSSDGQPEFQPCKAMLLSLFDRNSLDTLKIDLWTTDMQVMEMDRFFYQTLRALADTYYKATQNAQLATDMQRFVHYFGEKTGILPTEG